MQWTNSPHFYFAHQYQELKGDVPHKYYDLSMQQGVMEYYHPEVGAVDGDQTNIIQKHKATRISLVPRPCFIKVTGGKTGPGRHCQGPSVHALVCPRIPGVTVISVWKPFRILV